jgi:hypothetical protein
LRTFEAEGREFESLRARHCFQHVNSIAWGRILYILRGTDGGAQPMATEYCESCRRFVCSRRKIGVGTLILCLVTFGSKFLGKASPQQQSPSNKPQATASKLAQEVQDENLPSIPPPKFRLYRFGTDVPTSYVVPADATDDQLRSLLWFFRQKVRTGAFQDIGITQPTTVQFGQSGYAWGMLTVFKGEKCANEYYISDGEMYAGWTVGFCGPGEHNDATYHWGIEGDPLKDSGTIRGKNGDLVEVFSYKDNWHPIPKTAKHSTGK